MAYNIDNIFRENDCDSDSDRLENTHEPSIYIFAYGSLLWNPGFEYDKCITGYIRGYVRRFWQGNVTHRGTVDKPGRVVTLVDDKEGITWGCAYKISGKLALKYLDERECRLGGYITEYTKFYPRLASEFSGLSGEAFPVLLYIATPQNSYWLGEDTVDSIANQISQSQGQSGHNVEYLMRLAHFMREEMPDVPHDDHLYKLEKRVVEILSLKDVNITSLMGNMNLPRILRDSHESLRRPVTFEYTSRVLDKPLRCLHI